MTNRTEFRSILRIGPQLVASRQLVVHVLVALGLVVTANAAPTICRSAPTESEAPVEQSESSGEAAAVHVQHRGRVGQCQLEVALRVEGRRVENRVVVTSIAPRPGHRLHNNLLAPLRC